MSTGQIAVLAVVGTIVVVFLVLGAWLWDRNAHRRSLESTGRAHGPDGMRAYGESWRSVRGDGPPSFSARTRRGELRAGDSATDGETGCTIRSTIEDPTASCSASDPASDRNMVPPDRSLEA